MADRRYNLSVKIKALEDVSRPFSKIAASFRKMGKEAKKARKNFRGFAKDLNKASESSFGKGLGQKVFSKFGGLAAGVGLLAFGKSAVSAAVDFQSAMNMVGAVTRTQIGNNVSPEFAELTALARKMGATTQFSATEAAEGMKNLAMAGLTPAQIKAGALERSLELAASAQLDLGSAADIVTNIMSGYQMEVGQLTMVNDTLVNAFTRANTDLRGLGEAFKFVGPVAKAAGMDFKEATAAISLMSSAGIKAEMAGTALRGMITRLSAPMGKGKKLLASYGIQVFGADGQMKSLADIMGQFIKKGVPFNKIIRIMGQRAGPAFQALLGSKYNGKTGPAALKEFAEALKEQGTAMGLAQSQMKGLPGALKLFKSAFESLQLSIVEGSFGDALDTTIRGLAGFMQQLSEGVSFGDSVDNMFNNWAQSFGEWVRAVTETGESDFFNTLKSFADIVAEIGVEFDDLINTVTDFFTSIPELVTKAYNFINSKITSILPDFVKDFFGPEVNVSKSINNVSEAKTEAEVKVLVQSSKDSTATIEGLRQKGGAKVSAKTNSFLGDLFLPRTSVGGA